MSLCIVLKRGCRLVTVSVNSCSMFISDLYFVFMNNVDVMISCPGEHVEVTLTSLHLINLLLPFQTCWLEYFWSYSTTYWTSRNTPPTLLWSEPILDHWQEQKSCEEVFVLRISDMQPCGDWQHRSKLHCCSDWALPLLMSSSGLHLHFHLSSLSAQLLETQCSPTCIPESAAARPSFVCTRGFYCSIWYAVSSWFWLFAPVSQTSQVESAGLGHWVRSLQKQHQEKLKLQHHNQEILKIENKTEFSWKTTTSLVLHLKPGWNQRLCRWSCRAGVANKSRPKSHWPWNRRPNTEHNNSFLA